MKIPKSFKLFATTITVEIDNKRMDTFYHEKVHCLLDAMNKRDLSADEEFVDVFAKLLRQSDETAEY